jgi:hypothetical protein
VSVNSEQQQLMAEFENREEIRERRGRPSAKIWREPPNSAESAGSLARHRDIGDDPALIEAAEARPSGFQGMNAGSEPHEEALGRRPAHTVQGAAERRRVLNFTALIIVIGVVGLTASSVSRRKLSNPVETTLIGRETRAAKPRSEEIADPYRPNQHASIGDAQPADVPSDDRGSAPASITSPETPPTRIPGGAKHDDLGYVLAPIEEVATKPKLLFDQAPPLNPDSSSEPSKVGEAENSSDVEKVGAAEKQAKSVGDELTSNCLVKVDRRIIINRSCEVSWTNQQQVTFELAGEPLTIFNDHGRTWLATLGSQELGKVYKRGSCWGSKRVYICEHHK